MLDISHELVNKLTLNIIRHPDSDSKIGVAELVKGMNSVLTIRPSSTGKVMPHSPRQRISTSKIRRL